MTKKMNAKTSESLLMKLAAQARSGDGAAACRLGDIYREGNGADQSWEQSFRWYTLGARAGDGEAQNNLGTLYLEGLYCAEDFKQAVYWYRRSAEQGKCVAQYNLGMRYLHGQGVNVDYSEAMQLLKLAAEQDYNLANFDIGIMYVHGEGCTPDESMGLRFLMKGANCGDERAVNVLADKVPEMEELAFNGSIDDWLALVDLYYDRLQFEDSKARGWAWLLWAEAHAPLELGCLLIEIVTDRGRNTSQANKKKGQKLFKAMMLERGQAVPAKQAADAAASSGVTDSAQRIGLAEVPGKWLDACDPNAPIGNGRKKNGRRGELILSLGAEGGGIDLYGMRAADGSWSVWRELNDWTPELLDEPAIHRTTDAVPSWDAAMADLDQSYPDWMRLYPSYVHPEFRRTLLALIERRLIVGRLLGTSGEVL